MFTLKVLFITFFFVSAICGGEGKKGDSGNGKHEKMKQCIDETQQLKECCPYPVDESTDECKSHLDGVEDKMGKEKHEAFSCYFECKFDMKGLITDGALNKEKIHIEAADYLKGTDFTEISTSSIDYCYDELDKKTGNDNREKKDKKEDDDKKKCSKKPGKFALCYMSNIVRNCPASIWTSTETCEDLKANTTSMEECMN